MSTFVALMRRYCFDYTNRHDVTQVPGIMEPNYTLRMGQHELAGRDTHYVPAASAQFKQFPGLGLTVHEIFSNGKRLAMRFSEHGQSVKHGGRAAAWSGLGLYRWNQEKLTDNSVEQDYYSRRLQLDGAPVHAIESPAVAPWDVKDEPAQPSAESAVCKLIESGTLLSRLTIDDAWAQPNNQPEFSNVEYQIDDIFSAGNNVAFRVVLRGTYLGGLPEATASVGKPTTHYFVGVAQMRNDDVAGGRVISDRLGLVRRLAE